MNQGTKSAIFVGAAVLATLGAWLARPTMPASDAGDVRNQLLIQDFDPATVASLKIVDFDEETATPRSFRGRRGQHKGKVLCSIPSHDDYPADAQNQLAEAATALLGLKILDVAGDSQRPRTLRRGRSGVEDLAGASGVGTRVVMKDKQGATLLSLIIGKAVQGQPDLHYVRRDNEYPVYVVKVKTDKLSAKFADWIEKDLLKMNLWDLKRCGSAITRSTRSRGNCSKKARCCWATTTRSNT